MQKVYKLSLVVLLVAVILLVWDGCSKSAQLSLFKKRVSNLNLKAQVFNETIGKDKLRIAEQQQIILSQEDAINNGILMINDFNNIESQVRVETRTQIDSVFIPFERVKIDKSLFWFSLISFFCFLINPYFLSGLMYPFLQFGLLSGNSMVKLYLAELQSPFTAKEIGMMGTKYFTSPLLIMHIAALLSIFSAFRSLRKKQFK